MPILDHDIIAPVLAISSYAPPSPHVTRRYGIHPPNGAAYGYQFYYGDCV